MSNRSAIELNKHDGTWEEFERDWTEQCSTFDEDFGSYAEGTFTVVRSLIEQPEARSAVYGFKDGDRYIAMCQINVTPLPGYDGPVLRVRFMTLSPNFDFGELSVEEYADALVGVFAGVLFLSEMSGWTSAKHIKFHLRSPADRQFFASLGRALNEVEEFESVHTKGAWLYVTRTATRDTAFAATATSGETNERRLEESGS